MGTGECAPLTVGVAVGATVGDLVGDGVGAAAQAHARLFVATEYPVVPVRVKSPSKGAA
jgi:hypothetical protein